MVVEIICWVNFFLVTATKAHAGVEVQLQAFCSTRLVWSASLLVHHIPGVTAGLLDTRAVLNALKETKIACFFQESNQYSSVAQSVA
jgi:hypothetical protein